MTNASVMEYDADVHMPIALRRRPPWFAALLSVLVTGLGQIYAGRTRRGLAFWGASVIVGPAGAFLAMRLVSLGLFVLALIGTITVTIACAIDAWRLARRGENLHGRSRIDRWYTYATVVVLWVFVGAPRYQRWLRAHVAQAYRNPSEAMAPTIEDGDLIFATPKHDASRRGEVVVFHRAEFVVVMRVAALAGDTIAMRGGQLFISGSPVSEPYRRAEKQDVDADEFNWQRSFVLGKRDTTNYRPTLMTWGPLLVPKGKVFVLGDNRGTSRDGRYVGFTDVDSVMQSPRVVYFSWDAESHSVRWGRIGRRLDGVGADER